MRRTAIAPAAFARHLILLLLFVPFSQVLAQPKIVHVITDPSSQVAQDLVTQIQLGLADKDIIWKLADYRQVDPAVLGQHSADSLILTVGTLSARSVEKLTTIAPVLQVLVSRSAFDHVRDNAMPAMRQHLHAIFLDQPYHRLFRFSAKVLRQYKGASVLLGPSTKDYADEIKQTASAFSLDFHSAAIEQGEEARSIKSLFAKTYPVIAIPDSVAFSASNSKWLLYMAYQEKIPVIGFSPAFVHAGALAAIYTPPDLIARQTSEVIADWLEGQQDALPFMQYPKYFDIQFNATLANALRIKLPDRNDIINYLMRAEERQ